MRLPLALVALSLVTFGCSREALPPSSTAPLTPLGPPERPLSTGGYQVLMQGDELVMPEQIEFDVDKATIRNSEQSQRVLGQLLSILKARPGITKLRIEGHTDNTGSHAHNARLSAARAEAVAKWLVDHDIDRARLKTIGLGETRPVAGNSSPAGRQQNRRTEFHVEEMDGKSNVASAGGAKSG